jgi:hypothetical protein
MMNVAAIVAVLNSYRAVAFSFYKPAGHLGRTEASF